MTTIEALTEAGYEVLYTISGGAIHLNGPNYKQHKQICVRIPNINPKVSSIILSFSENPSGCGSLILANNTYLKNISSEHFDKICNILKSYDKVGALTCVLGESLYDSATENALFDNGFTTIAEYLNPVHSGYTQKLYIKIL